MAQAQAHETEHEWIGEQPWEAAADPDAYAGAILDDEEAPR